MESFNHMGQENSSERGNFPQYLTPTMIAQQQHHHHQHQHMDMNMSMGPLSHHLQPTANYFHPPSAEYQNHNHNHNQQGSTSNSSVKSEGAGGAHKKAGSAVPPRFHNYPVMAREEHPLPHDRRNDDVLGMGSRNTSSGEVSEAMKAKIINHPHYSNLLQAYMECQKVGAPPDVSARLSATMEEYETRQRSLVAVRDASNDPELDQFMEAYCDMLGKYKEEIRRPVEEAMEFMQKIESQLNILTNGRLRILNSDERSEVIGSSEEDQENSCGETEVTEIDPRAEDRELKNHLLKKYSGYLSSLKQELSKKKKKGKLPKEARQKLLSWWELHYKWPYPSESEKVGLAETTGLDQKQINNWFINQRKRHWKPSEDMQFMVMDGLHTPHNAALYMDAHYLPDAPYRFGT